VRIERANYTLDKGWYAGPWESDLAVAVGYAHKGIDEPHVHRKMTEIYLVARGTSVLQVGQETVHLAAGDVAIIEPGEAHTFLGSSVDYFHFVVHLTGPGQEKPAADKSPVERSSLAL